MHSHLQFHLQNFDDPDKHLFRFCMIQNIKFLNSPTRGVYMKQIENSNKSRFLLLFLPVSKFERKQLDGRFINPTISAQSRGLPTPYYMSKPRKTGFPDEQALPSMQFVLHLRDCQGPIGRLLNISTGLCTFNGPVYMFPVPKATFSIYTGFLDSICEDIIFVAFIYNDRTPNTIEGMLNFWNFIFCFLLECLGEIRLYNVLSQNDEITFEPMNTNQLQMTMTFNRRALFRCVFWSKLREGIMVIFFSESIRSWEC